MGRSPRLVAFLGMTSSSFGSRTMVARHPKGSDEASWNALPPGIFRLGIKVDCQRPHAQCCAMDAATRKGQLLHMEL